MTPRKPISKAVQTNVLVKSRRRCALCFGLRGDLGEKKGQIAHLDQNPFNNSEDNLAWLCFDHHDQYDSKTSQSKGLTIGEVKVYRDKLYAQIALRLDSPFSEIVEKNNEHRLHDHEIFNRADQILSESHLRDFLGSLEDYDFYRRHQRVRVSEFCQYFGYESNAFLSSDVNGSVKQLVHVLEELESFLFTHFFPDPRAQISDDRIFDFDRELKHLYCVQALSPEQAEEYRKLREIFKNLCSEAQSSYSAYRTSVKEKLYR